MGSINTCAKELWFDKVSSLGGHFIAGFQHWRESGNAASLGQPGFYAVDIQ